MKVALPAKSIYKVVLPCLAVLCILCSYSPAENIDYLNLSNEWLKRALTTDVIVDPRLDDDQLRPVVNYDVEIIQVHNFESESFGSRIGEGWQIVGGVVDVIVNGNTKYVLYGRQNLYYRSGLWNNTIDTHASFEDYLVIRRKDGKLKILEHAKLNKNSSQTLIGLRRSESGREIEVVQNSSLDGVQVVWSYMF